MLVCYFYGRNGFEKLMELICLMRFWVEFGKEVYGLWNDGEVVVFFYLLYDCISRLLVFIDVSLFI